MAENELQKTEDLAKTLSDSKTVRFCFYLHILYAYISCILMLLSLDSDFACCAVK